MTTFALLAHLSGAPHVHAASVTNMIIGLALLVVGQLWRKAARTQNLQRRNGAQ